MAQEAVEEAAELGKVLNTAAEKTGEALAEEVPRRLWASYRNRALKLAPWDRLTKTQQSKGSPVHPLFP